VDIIDLLMGERGGVYLKVPLGQGCGVDVPSGQKEPGGQAPPVRASAGEACEAPPVHT